MAPIKTKFTPIRNQAGRFIKFVRTTEEGSSVTTMKPYTPMKGKKIRKAHLSSDTPRIGKKTSIVWNFFRALPHENGISRAVCILCKVVFKNPGGSTTGMRGHLERKHPGVVENLMRSHYRVESSTLLAKKETKPSGEGVSESNRQQLQPPPQPLAIENGAAVGEVGETQIFEEEQETMIELEIDNPNQTSNQSLVRRGKHILPGPPPDAYTMNEAEETTKFIVLFLASNLTPIYSVDGPYFKKMIQNLNGSFALRVSQNNDSLSPIVESTMENMYQELKAEVRREIQDKIISLNIELWAKSHFEIYAFTSANYVGQDWRLQSKFLGLRLIPDLNLDSLTSTCEEKISSVISSLLSEYNVKKERVINISLNSYPFNDSKFRILSLPTSPCFVEVLKRSYDVLNRKVDTFTTFSIRSDCCRLGVKCLRNFEDLKEHPGRLVESLKRYLINPTTTNCTVVGEIQLEMQHLASLSCLQKPLNDIVDCLLDEASFTASTIIPMLYALRDLFEAEVENGEFSIFNKDQKKMILGEICSFLQTTFDVDLSSNDIGGKILAMCTFLDPRYKKMMFFNEEQKQSVHDSILELLYESGRKKPANSGTGSIISVRTENPDYAIINADSSTIDPLNVSESPISPQTSSRDGTPSKMVSILSGVIQRKHVPAPTNECQEELRKYFREPVPIMQMDPCEWWSGNSNKYPNLSSIAKRYLCMNGSTVSARVAFTNAGDRFYRGLSTIESQYVDKLLCLRKHQTVCSDLVESVDLHNDSETDVMEPSDIFRVKTETVHLMDEEEI